MAVLPVDVLFIGMLLLDGMLPFVPVDGIAGEELVEGSPGIADVDGSAPPVELFGAVDAEPPLVG